jgi:hypothetical protein
MPTNTVIDQISDLTKAIGDVYDAVHNGIGSSTVIGSSIYNLLQLQSIASSGLPSFGFIYGPEGAAANVAVSYDPSDPYYVQVSGGQVSYNGVRIQIASGKVPIKATFASTYDTSYAYGIVLGFPVSEAIKSTSVNTTTTSQAIAGNSSLVAVKNASIAVQLGFPLQAQISGYYIRFSGVDATGNNLIVDPSFYNGSSYGTTPNVTLSAGASVYFVYEPQVMAIYGLPTSVGTYSAAAYTYYPFMPDDWLPVALVLAKNPSNPVVCGSGPYEIIRTATVYPAPESGDTLFTSDMATTIARATATTQASLQQAQDSASVTQMIGAFEQYTSQIAQNTQTSFSSYWAQQPFQPTSYFSRSVSFDGIERMDFSDAFKRAYYAMRHVDLVHTFAIFRGDLYEFAGSLTGNPPSSVAAHSYGVQTLCGLSPNNSLSRGSYTYGVTAVTMSGETIPTYVTVRASSASPGYFFNHIEWAQVSSAAYYHVYRKAKSGLTTTPASIVGDYSEYRLTADNEALGYGLYSQANITYGTTRQLTHVYEAFQFVATGTWLQGVALRVSRGPSPISQSNSLVVTLCSQSASAPGAVISTDLGTIPFSALTTGWQDFNLVFQHGGVSLTAGSYYWITITTSSSIGSDVVNILTGTETAPNIYATSPDGTSWTTISNILPYYRLMYGFIDNGRVGLTTTRRGLKITGQIALKPSRLRVYVPPVSNLIAGTQPDVQVSGDTGVYTTDNPESTITRNEMVVTVTAQNGTTGIPVAFTVTVPKGTPRNTQFLLGVETDLFDRVIDVQVSPGSNVRLGANNQILWHIYDLITVETTP